MNVHGCCDIVAFALHHISNHFGQQIIPFFSLGHRIDVRQHAFIGPFLNRWAFDLSGCGRVASNSAALQSGLGVVTTTTGHCKVFPFVTLGFEHFFQFSHRLGLTAGSPVVQHFYLSRLNSQRASRDGHRSGQF